MMGMRRTRSESDCLQQAQHALPHAWRQLHSQEAASRKNSAKKKAIVKKLPCARRLHTDQHESEQEHRRQSQQQHY
eukprot:6195037-Pleurochrysis_carterae.AAC.2